uniref:flagellar basal body-associated protein FliL n=1 Tax=Thaumasiovibrio occultus TaxID=1891184 RepID=UPI000B34CA7C|nr:flagellar basal body-associated protein FliL [Thaumasiovibrio occultus]
MAATENNVEQAKGGKKNLLIFGLIGIVLLAAGAGAAFFVLSGDEPAPVEPVASADAALPRSGPALYVTLPEPFIFNVMGDSRDRLVQVNVQLMVRGEGNEAIAKTHAPLIRSTLLTAFSAATVEQLRLPNGRVELRAQSTEAVQRSMEKVSGKPVVDRVLFTGFVMQ